MPGLKRLAGALAVAATAVAISACGSSSSDKTLTPEQANELTVALNGVETAVASGKCGRAESMAQDFVTTVNGLPDTVGTADKEALRSAGENLQKLGQSECNPSNTTGASGPSGVDPTTSTTSTTPPEVTTTTTPTTTSTTSKPPPAPPPSNSGGGSGGGPPTGTPPGGGNTGGGGDTGGGGAAGGGGGTGSGGTGGTGVGGGGGTG